MCRCHIGSLFSGIVLSASFCFAIILLSKSWKAGCFTSFVFLLSCSYLYSMSLPCDGMGCSVVCNKDVSCPNTCFIGQLLPDPIKLV